MFDVDKPKGYEGLMERLTSQLGIRLSEAQQKHGLSDVTIARMMSHCAGCGESADCTQKLSPGTTQLTAPPNYCYNRKLLLWLKAEQDKIEDEAKP